MTQRRILLIDADSQDGFPNLALMKVSAHHKALGDRVILIRGIPTTAPLERYDLAYMSCIFYQNADRAVDYLNQLRCPFRVGGTGSSLTSVLSDEIEHTMPDYALYGVDFSMGFTSRGCIRHCGFCVVPEKEGTIHDNAPISEFLHPDHTRLMLLDNNFLASPRWRENLGEIIERGLRVNFNQGLDIRLVDEEKAMLLASTKTYSWNFKTRGLHFAFDTPGIESSVRRGIALLEYAGIPPRRLMFYVLCGYNTTEEEDLHRVEVLKELGVVPYVMPYNRMPLKITRWVNRRYHEFIPYSIFRGPTRAATTTARGSSGREGPKEVIPKI